MKMRLMLASACAALLLTGCGEKPGDSKESQTPAFSSEAITADSFGCISDLTAVDRYFVGNLAGDLDGTIAVAKSETGGTYPTGSVVQLVPTEVMVKLAPGSSPATKDWEFFELDVSAEGTKITTRGGADVVNRFGGRCLECHEKAQPQWDLICKTDHGCDPIPFTDAMIRGIQKTDPRCAPQELTAEEQEGLKMLQAATA
ncbi:MAG: hypothetical protein R3E18_13170 [Sphingomonadaceae bacterium]|nr:hypothetical protein [Sphingomonadaceae bacterium]